MAKIQTVDYEKMPSEAKQMRQEGNVLNNEMTTAYNSVKEMHSSWYGKRYNELAKSFNNMIPQLNELLELVVREIPSTLETIANNYSQADRGQNATTVDNTSAKKIENITITEDVGMRFITSTVESVQQQVERNFQKSIEQMNKIESIFNQVTWESEAADAFRNKFNKLKSNIIESFNEIKSQFTKLMNQTKEDIQSAETANTVQ